MDASPPPPGLAPATACDPGDLAQVAFALVAHNPRLFAQRHRTIAGLPTTILYPILDEAPRYFAWLAAQGYLGTVHPWIAVAAGDFGRRIRWRQLAPPRGSGRLLWICEEMATRLHATTLVPPLFKAARKADISNPDWPATRPPRQCQLDAADYLGLLRDRATDTTFTDHPDGVDITCPNATTVTLWTDQTYHPTPQARTESFRYPATADARGATVFTRRGDYLSHGWLSTYNTIR